MNPNKEPNLPRSITFLTRLLDQIYIIPGTKISLGLDALIGLIPGVGDALSYLISCIIIYQAAIIGAPKVVLARMCWNVAVDTLLGIFPVIGDIFDVFIRANSENLTLLKSVDAEKLTPRTGRDVLNLIRIAAVLIIAAVLVAVFFISRFLWQLLSQTL